MNDQSNDELKSVEHSDTEADDVVFEAEGETVADTLKKLREKLKACQKEKEEYLAGWQRAKADYANAQKEGEKARAEFALFAKREALMEFVTVADSFDMAFANREAWEKVDKNWRVGVEYIYSQLLAIFEQNGLKQLNPIGEMFDPKLHASVRSVAAEKPEDDHKIVTVIQKGYTMNDAVVRSPKVEVAIFEGK